MSAVGCEGRVVVSGRMRTLREQLWRWVRTTVEEGWGWGEGGLRCVVVLEIDAAGLRFYFCADEEVVRCHELGFFGAVGDEDECGGHGVWRRESAIES